MRTVAAFSAAASSAAKCGSILAHQPLFATLCLSRGEDGYLRLKREPWRVAGQPYWKGIYSASQPTGKMKSTASMKPMLECSNSTGPAPVITVNSTTARMAVTLLLAGVEGLASDDAARAVEASLQAALRKEWITNSFRVLVKDVRLLGWSVEAGEDILASSELRIVALARVVEGKAVDATTYAIESMSRVLAALGQSLSDSGQGAGRCRSRGVPQERAHV